MPQEMHAQHISAVDALALAYSMNTVTEGTAPVSFKSFWLVSWRSSRPPCAALQCPPQSLSVPLSTSWQVFPMHAFWVFGGWASCDEEWQDWASRCRKESTTSRVSGSAGESMVPEEAGTSYGSDLPVGICSRCFQPQIWRSRGSGVPCFGPLSGRSRPFRSTWWSWFGFRFAVSAIFLASSPAHLFAKSARWHFGTTT